MTLVDLQAMAAKQQLETRMHLFFVIILLGIVFFFFYPSGHSEHFQFDFPKFKCMRQKNI